MDFIATITITLGELCDRILIYRLKLAHAPDAAIAEWARSALEPLERSLSNFDSRLAKEFRELAAVHHELWNLEDNIRERGASDVVVAQIARRVRLLNDRRAELRRLIDLAAGTQPGDHKMYRSRL